MAEPGQELKVRNVKIQKSQSLGVGAYGSVYRATCDQLPCAAKLLHKVLVNRKERRNLEKFEQECHFLSRMRHPNIVQYLGTHKDSKSGIPILLMELMDENLNNFLERSQEPLPYHLEVNLCHDVALALAYLHSNDIIHRDLSSNNVLLIAGSRAKVTDFGMSKLLDAAPQTTPLTQCPGTAVYMSPEALRIPPVYTKLLDCFSHGVLGIQIMTRKFPSPGSNEEVIEDPRSPVGMIKIPIPDKERRKPHIDCIDPNHPLLPIAIQCLSYNERDRLSSQELCHQIAALKEDPQYDQSLQRAQERGRREQSTVDMEKQMTELQRKVAVQERENCQLSKETQQLTLQLMEQLQEREEALKVTKQEIEQLYHDNRSLRKELEQAEQVREEAMKQAEEEKEHQGEKARQIREKLVKRSNNDRMMLRAAQQANEQLHQCLEEAVQEIGRLNTENLQLNKDNQEMTRENLQLNKDKQEMTRENLQGTANEQRFEQDKEELTQDKQRLTQQLTATQQSNQQLTQDKQRLTQQLTATQQSNQQLSINNQQLSQQLAATKQANQQLGCDLDMATRTSQQLARDKERLMQDLRGKEYVIEGKERQLRENEYDIAKFEQTLMTKTQEIQQLTQDLRDRNEQIEAGERLRRENEQSIAKFEQTLMTKTQEIQQLTRDLKDRDEQIEARERQLRDNEQNIAEFQQALMTKTQDNQQLTQDLRDRDEQIEAGERQLRDNEQNIAKFEQTLMTKTQEIQQLTRDLRDRDEQIEARERLLRDNEQNIAEFQKTLIHREMEVRALKETIATKEAQLMQLHTTSEASNSTKGGTIWLRWGERPKAPSTMYTEQAPSHGTTAYFSESGHVHAYDSTKEEWSELPKCPQEGSTLVVVKDLLTAVGGDESGKRTNTLLSLKYKGITKKWSKHFPPMPTKRTATAAVCSGRSLVVAGGSGEKLSSGSLTTVEVMDTDTPQWSTASSLSHPVQKASMAICGDNLYLLGGYSQSGHPSKFVLACSLSALLQTSRTKQRSHSVKEGTQGSRERPHSLQDDPRTVWNRVANVPALATCTTLCGHLLVIGGCDSDKSYTNDILQYDPAMNTWTVIGRMPTPRAQSLVAVLPGDKLMVVGGWNSSGWTDAVEIASVI